MTLAIDLVTKGFIDIQDDINFRTHADVLKLFGKNHKIFQRAFAKHPFEEGVHIWFPIVGADMENGWRNNFDKSETRIFEQRLEQNIAYLDELFEMPERHKRILFAKIAPFGRAFYKFKGVFHFDADLSRIAKKAAYQRISTCTKVYPSDNPSARP
jgi:SET and RING associated domain